MTKALIIVDYENEWIDKSSEYYVGDISKKLTKLNKLIKFCREKNIPIIFTTHIEPDSKTAFAEGTKRVEIIEKLDFQPKKDILIKKNKISPFFKTRLEQILRKLNVEELIITGILTNLCVRSCVSDAYDRGYRITVIKDTCVAFSDEIQKFTFKDLKNTRPEIEFLTVNEFIKKNS
jgi:nicotinamidase-related amidase